MFHELQKYKAENGSLSIPPGHPTYAKVIDSLTVNQVDSVIRRRWMQRFDNVKSLEQQLLDGAPNHESNVDADLGKWIQTQLDHYILYKEGLPNPLNAKQIELLEDIGLQNLLKLRSVAEGSVLNETKGSAGNSNQNDEGAKDENVATSGDFNEDSSKEKSTTECDSSTLMSIKHETGFDTNNDDPIEEGDRDNNLNTATNMETTDSTSEFKSIGGMKGKCDVCRKKDGFQGHNLQRCRDCGLKVHELCYGLVATDSKNFDFVCYACKAIGTKVEVNVPSIAGGPISKKNKREYLMQEARPTECILCSFDNGEIHAMHPIMDTHGPDGRQLVLPKTKTKERRLAWAHTLCASFICSNPLTRSCVYGLNEDNDCDSVGGDEEFFEEEDESEDEIYVSENKTDDNKQIIEKGKVDNEVDNNSNDDSKQMSVQEIGNQVAFAIAGKEDKAWYSIIKQQRRYMCFICGKDDTKSLRIPVQCIVDEEWDGRDEDGEFIEFKRWRENFAKIHSEPEFLEGREANCSVAMHVGCARWKADLETVAEKKSHLVYFYSGQQTGCDGDIDFGNPVANCYCPAHARQLIIGNEKNAAKVEKSTKIQTQRNQSEQARKKRQRSPPRKEVQPSPKRGRGKGRGKNKGKNKIKSPKKKNSPKKFGKQKSTVAISGTNKEHYSILGRSGRALSAASAESKPSGENKHPAIVPVSNNTHNTSVDSSPIKAATKPNHSLRNLLDKVADTASLQAKPAATVTVLAARDDHRSSSTSVQFTQNTRDAAIPSSAPKPVLNKPVGILKNKAPGPINANEIDQSSSEAKTNTERTDKRPTVKQEPLTDSTPIRHGNELQTNTQHPSAMVPDITTSS